MPGFRGVFSFTLGLQHSKKFISILVSLFCRVNVLPRFIDEAGRVGKDFNGAKTLVGTTRNGV